MEEPGSKIWLWEAVSQSLMDPSYLNLLIKYKDVPLLGMLMKRFLNHEFMKTYEILSSLIMSIKEVVENRAELPMHNKYLDVIIKELKDDRDKAEERMYFLTDTYPDLIKMIQSK